MNDVLAGLFQDAIREVREGRRSLEHGERSGAIRALGWANKALGMAIMTACHRGEGRLEYRATENRVRRAIDDLTKRLIVAVTPRPRGRRLDAGVVR